MIERIEPFDDSNAVSVPRLPDRHSQGDTKADSVLHIRANLWIYTTNLVIDMSILETLEQQVQQLDSKEYARFRDWFLAFEADAWDRQIEQDAKAGKLDALARKALQDHAAGQTTSL